MADAETLAAGPPAAGTLSLDTAYLSNNFASLAGTNTAVQAGQTAYSYSAYSYSAPGGTVAVPGLSEPLASSGNKADATGWAGLSDTVKYVIYAAAGVVALLVLGIVIWLCIRRSKKRKAQETRQNARLTTRSSFASPMHERETLQPHTASAFNYNNANDYTHEYKEPAPGIFRTDTSYTNSSMEKNRYGADAQSVHSIPPVYAPHSNGTRDFSRSAHTAPGDMSGATLINGQSGSEISHDNYDNLHQILPSNNTSLSSFKAVAPPGSRAVASARAEELSYPPRQSHGVATAHITPGTPVSDHKQQSRQPQRQQRQEYEEGLSQQYQYGQEERQRSYSRNGPLQQQQQHPVYQTLSGPTSPSYSDASGAAGGRDRGEQVDAYPSTIQAPAPVAQDYFSSPEGSANRNAAATDYGGVGRQPLSPTSQSASASHRYRMPPQNRHPSAQRAMSPPASVSQQAVYHNPYAASVQGNDNGPDPYSAGRGDSQQQQQQYYNQAYSQNNGHHQDRQHQQQDYSRSYNDYRQY